MWPTGMYTTAMRCADIAKQILKKNTLRVHLPLPVVRAMALGTGKARGLERKGCHA